ncbi:MAG: hypothetical protein AB7K71_30475 [Polyangiaceae bacterium]
MALLLTLSCSSVIACGSKEHPSPIGATGGSSAAAAGGGGSGGSATGGNTTGGAAGSAGAAASGGSASTAGTGGVTPLVTFDPNRVYVQGLSSAGDCSTWVVALPESPGETQGTFPCENSQLALRGQDGALAYSVAANDYRLWETDFIASGFPPFPETNDVPLDSPSGCEVAAQFFEVANNERVVRCEDGRVLSSAGELDLQGDTLLGVGKSGVLLTANAGAFALRKANGVTPVELGSASLTLEDVEHARAFGDGFLLLARPTASTPPPALRIAPDGSVTQLADYPTATGMVVLATCRLEPSGVAVCLGYVDSTESVLRFDPQGTTEVVYQEAAGLSLAGARLFTGP